MWSSCQMYFFLSPSHSPTKDDNVEHIGDDAKDADAQTEATVHLPVAVDELQQALIVVDTLIFKCCCCTLLLWFFRVISAVVESEHSHNCRLH